MSIRTNEWRSYDWVMAFVWISLLLAALVFLGGQWSKLAFDITMGSFILLSIVGGWRWWPSFKELRGCYDNASTGW